MTYCAVIHPVDGLVFASDSRTSAEIDHIAIFRKLFTFGMPDERLPVVQTAGNLATSRSVINLLQQRIHRDGANLLNVPSVCDATVLIAETTREVIACGGDNLVGNTDLSCSFLTDGQITGGPPALHSICPQGNLIQATPDTPFLQLGESKYSRPILGHDLAFDTPLGQALRCAPVSFDSTIRSNLSVSMPPDLPAYHRDSLILSEGYRVTEDDAYFSAIRRQWGVGLRNLLERLPSPPSAHSI